MSVSCPHKPSETWHLLSAAEHRWVKYRPYRTLKPLWWGDDGCCSNELWIFHTDFHSSLIEMLRNYQLHKITGKINSVSFQIQRAFAFLIQRQADILIRILLLWGCLITKECRCGFEPHTSEHGKAGVKLNSIVTHSGNISTYCSNLFSHMASSSLALGAIVTHAAQQKLSLPPVSIPDADTWSIPVWGNNNAPTFGCQENTRVHRLNRVCNTRNIMCDHSSEKYRKKTTTWRLWMVRWFINRTKATLRIKSKNPPG